MHSNRAAALFELIEQLLSNLLEQASRPCTASRESEAPCVAVVSFCASVIGRKTYDWFSYNDVDSAVGEYIEAFYNR